MREWGEAVGHRAMLTPNLSDAMLVFLYGVMLTLFVLWVRDQFRAYNLDARVQSLVNDIYDLEQGFGFTNRLLKNPVL
jgi:hypothetical protein